MKHRPDTLVVLSPAFPAHEADSAWVPSQQLFVRALRRQFPALQVVVLSFIYPHHTDSYSWHGAQVMAFNGMSRRKLRRPLLWRDIWRQLDALRAGHRLIGLFSFWCGECALLGHYYGRRHRIPHYSWICGQDARKTNTLVRFIRPRAQELVAMSPFLAAEFYRNHGIRPAHLVPNAIDTSLFPPPPPVKDIDIMGAGSLIPQKQYHLFVQAVQQLRRRLPGLKAVLCGGGGEQERLQNMINAAGLDDHCRLTGPLSHTGVLPLLQRARVFLHPSAYEGYSTVCLEALYAGAHVISFCAPQEQPLPRWHVVGCLEEMVQKAKEILLAGGVEHNPLLLHDMNDSARAVMRLFDYAPAAPPAGTPAGYSPAAGPAEAGLF